jgi:hypothetical protein
VILASGVLLLWTAFTKLRAPSTFAETLAQHEVIPPMLIAPVSWAVPCIELLVGVIGVGCVLLQRGVAGAGLGVSVLFAMFSAYAFVLHIRPPPVPTGCGCGLPRGPVADWPLIAAMNAAGSAVLGVSSLRSVDRRSRPAA